MYREDSWEDGFYICNMDKYKCEACGKEFIVGKELCQERPVCPYCKNSDAHWMSGTEDDRLEELASEMGCLAIYKNEDDEEGINKVNGKLSLMRNILERANIQMLRECLIQGDNQEAFIDKDHDQRLYKSYEDIDRFLEKCCPENDSYSDELMGILDDQVNIYMEVGIKAGFLLAIDIMKR